MLGDAFTDKELRWLPPRMIRQLSKPMQARCIALKPIVRATIDDEGKLLVKDVRTME